MRHSLLNALACPACKSFPLRLHAQGSSLLPWALAYELSRRTGPGPYCDTYCSRLQRSVKIGDTKKDMGCADCIQEEIQGGALACSGCDKTYPIIDGIPSFVEHSPATGNTAQRTEQTFRDRHCSTYESVFSSYTNDYEVRSVIKELSPNENERVLEIGAGTGRISSRLASRCEELVCVDFSLESLRYLRTRPGILGTNAGIVHADIQALPLRTGYFHKMISCQVLEHVPTADLLRRVLSESRRILKPAGISIASVYNYSWPKRWKALIWPRLANDKGWLKTGSHGSSVYYRNFNAKELKAAMGQFFSTLRIYGLLVPLTGRGAGAGTLLDLCLRPTPLSLFLGELLVIRCASKAD